MIRIMIADDHALFRQGLSLLLRSASGHEIVGEASSGEEALRIIYEARPDLAILDISMPGLGGVEVLREVRRQGLPVKVILVTMHTDPELAREAMEEGVSGYLLKEDAFEDLLAAVQAIMTGGLFISPRMASAIFPSREAEGHSGGRLTRREREILRSVASGKTNKEIGEALFISVKTVETHRARIMDKLGIHSTAGLVRYAIRKGIAGP